MQKTIKKTILLQSSKKAAALWLSWILIVGLAVAMGIFIQRWIITLSQKDISQMQRVVYDTAECDSIGLSIDNICQDTQLVYMNITNTRELEVKALFLRTFTIYGTPGVPGVVEKNLSIRPGQTNVVTIFKEGSIKRLEIVPILSKDDRRIICTGKTLSTESIEKCY